jgi:hypothetical protein
MVLAQDGANVGQVQHLALTCLQDQLNGQLAVQQYHIQSRVVYPVSPRHVAIEDIPSENGDDESEHPSSVPSVETDLMNLMGDQGATVEEEEIAPQIQIVPTPPLGFSSSATGGKAGVSIISANPNSLPPGSFPDFAFMGTQDPLPPPAPSVALPSQSVDIGVKSKGILLNALKIRPPDTQSSSNSATMVVSKESKEPPAHPQPAVKVETETSHRRAASSPSAKAINHSEAQSSFDVVNKKAEKNSLPPPNTTVTTNSQSHPTTIPDSGSLSSKIRKVPFDISKLMPSSSTSSTNDNFKKELSSADKDREEDEWEKASMTISRSFVGSEYKDSNDQSSRSEPITSSSSLEQHELLKSLSQQVSMMQNTLQSLAHDKKFQQTNKRGTEVTTKHLAELKVGIIQEVTNGVGDLVLGALEEHSAEAVAKILGSEQWREEVTLSPLHYSLIPSLTLDFPTTALHSNLE